MSRRGIIGLGVLGFFSFLVFLVAKLPASVILPFAGDIPDVELRGASGTLWEGRIASVHTPELQVGPVEWSLSAWPLLRGQAQADVRADVEDGQLNGRLRANRAGDIEFHDLRGQFPIALIRPYLAMEVDDLSGQGAFDIEYLTLREMRPYSARGELRVLDLELRVQQHNFQFGAYQGELTGNEGEMSVRYSDAGGEGPWDLDGEARLEADYSFQVEGRVRARDDAPDHLRTPLEYLGSADDDGYRTFSFGGSL